MGTAHDRSGPRPSTPTSSGPSNILVVRSSCSQDRARARRACSMARISHLVAERGVRPERILALTFSRRAADEISERVPNPRPDAALVGERELSLLRPLRRAPPPHPLASVAHRVMATGEQWALSRSSSRRATRTRTWGLSPGALARPATVREVYDLRLLRCQEHLLEPRGMRALGEKMRRPYLARAAALLERYRSSVSEIYLGGGLRGGRPVRTEATEAGTVKPNWRARYLLDDHVLVDEFQDTNRQPARARTASHARGDPEHLLRRGRRAEHLRLPRGQDRERQGVRRDISQAQTTIHLRTNFRSAPGRPLAEDAIAGDKEPAQARRGRQWAPRCTPGTVLYEISPSPREEGRGSQTA